MKALEQWSDEQLLHDRKRPDDTFATFYRRHVLSVLAFYARQGTQSTTAGDLAAETFAAALLARRRYRPDNETARPWLLTIAARKLADSHRRGAREDRARRQLGIESVALDAQDAADYAELPELVLHNESDAVRALATLPDGQRSAVEKRVVDGQSYEQVAADLSISRDAARQNVHRGLAALRARLKENR